MFLLFRQIDGNKNVERLMNYNFIRSEISLSFMNEVWTEISHRNHQATVRNYIVSHIVSKWNTLTDVSALATTSCCYLMVICYLFFFLHLFNADLGKL